MSVSVATLDIVELDKSLATFVPKDSLAMLASRGLQDELVFPVPLGPMFRGGANVKKGTAGIAKVFDAVHRIVKNAATHTTSNRIELKNAAGRTVLIEFASDPDIIIREQMPTDNFRKKNAIEVKCGSDFSNIHNRIGEAEKSHQKAHVDGFVECWTVVNVDKIDMAMAKQESPTTNRFYRISDLTAGKGAEYQDFRDHIVSLTGIKTPGNN